MSADNWALCPRCTDQLERDVVDAERAEIAADDANNLTAWREAHERTVEARLALHAAKSTFREDYEIYGADDGTVIVTYGGECQTCGLDLEFRHEHPLYERTIERTLTEASDA